MSTDALLALPFGLAIGLLLGLVGGGGSILAVPLLVYALGQPVRSATSESLLIVGAAALAGALDHGRAGNVRVSVAVRFGAAGSLGAIAGTALNRHVGGHALLLAFAALLLAAAAAMLRPRAVPHPPATVPARRAIAAGFATGVLTGFFGVGGGFVIVPALVLLLGLPLRAAVGTSLAVIAITSAAALAAHAASGGFAWTIAGASALAAIAGAVAGRRLGARLAHLALSRAFAVLLVAVALAIAAENVAAIVSS